ncbi:hypothetical protein LMG22037_06376 [Paraburkholderia phenoliruptrix]|uniref:Uncharacterized protein n=1 Tax=Paraburkholderia phenoliruptrix TaxID=252970 RepID=A0A6J5CQS3_9BURK|nr:hypothetical protein [Paraburkholderia phenoliruptrix]CAB3740255.1 hypothetical protein LMG22037_06376 [Paraburkholderia phenoliruptrix]
MNSTENNAMTMTTMIISIATLLTLLAALTIGLLDRWYGKHFAAAVECRKVLEADGQEQDHYSFTASRSNTFIGRTVGRVYIAFAAARYDRLVRKHQPIAAA